LLPAFSSVPSKSFDRFVVIIRKEVVGTKEISSPKIAEVSNNEVNEENERERGENMRVGEVVNPGQEKNSNIGLLLGGSVVVGSTIGLLVRKVMKDGKKNG